MVTKYLNFIDGKFIQPQNGEFYQVRNPFNNEIIAFAPQSSREDAQLAIHSARKAFDSGVWSGITPGERSNYLLKLADLIEKSADRLAKLESQNQGKTIKLARDGDIPFAIDNLRFFAGMARNLTGIASTEYIAGGTSIIRREPIGVVASITPWNYPFMMAIWKSAPALAAGNCVIMKPASVTPITTFELAKLVKKAGIPDGVFNVITGSGEIVGTELASSTQVDMISLTGNTETGKEIMRNASNNLKKVHLELGGKAPFIVFDDADLEAASESAVVGGFVNVGQDCTQASRFYVQEKAYKNFISKLVSKAKKLKLGNPLDRKTDMGPLVSSQQREKVEIYIDIAKKEGAKVALGGKRPAIKVCTRGFFLEPTIIIDCQHNMKVIQDEIFGPVLCVLKFKTEEEVIKKANDVLYGLYSSVWTKDIHKAFRVANSLKFGAVAINDHLPLASEMPHGGYKQSGFGKDLSIYSFEEYTQIKHIFVELTGTARKAWHYTVYGK